MSLPYEKITPILGASATEYPPESETTPTFMNGKFNELLANDKDLSNKINVLNALQNGVKFYSSLTQINSSFTITTSITDVFNAMTDNSIAMYIVGGSNTVYPAAYGQCIIYKSTGNRDSIEFLDSTANKKYLGTCHTSFSGGFSGWQQIATTTDYTINFANGWKNAYVEYNNERLTLRKIGGSLLIRGVITNPSIVSASSIVITTSCATKHIIHGYICGSASEYIGVASFILENGALTLTAPSSLTLGDGFIAFM